MNIMDAGDQHLSFPFVPYSSLPSVPPSLFFSPLPYSSYTP